MQKRDDPLVYCYDGDLDRAIKVLRKKVGNYGTFGALKFRKRYPSAGDRKKAKRYIAARRLVRARNRGNL